MKKKGIIILSTAAVAAGATLLHTHREAKERAKWQKYWDERHAEAAEARKKAVAAVKEAAEKGKQEVSDTYHSVSDAASEVLKNAATLVNPADKKDEVLEELHGALTNYLDSKKSGDEEDTNEKSEDTSDADSDVKENEEAGAAASDEDAVDSDEKSDEDSEPNEDKESDKSEESEEDATPKSEEKTEEVTEDAKVAEKAPAPPVDSDSDEDPLPAWDTVPVIGDGEGKISVNSDEYVTLLKEAIEKAEAEPTYHLVLGGKTYGLGAKGKSIGGDTAYDLDDLRKLLRKAEQGSE